MIDEDLKKKETPFKKSYQRRDPKFRIGGLTTFATKEELSVIQITVMDVFSFIDSLFHSWL
jgi:hypothetical protein